MQINGYGVFVSPLVFDVPKIEIRPSFKWISDSYRNRLNAELLEMFGTTEQVIVDNANRRIYVNESTFYKMKTQLKGCM